MNNDKTQPGIAPPDSGAKAEAKATVEAIPEGAVAKPRATEKEKKKAEDMSMADFMDHMRKDEKVRIGNKLYLGLQNANQVIYQKDRVGKMPQDSPRYAHYLSVRKTLVNAKRAEK